MKCKCHPDTPFHWKHNTRPSIFIRDIAFRVKGIVVTEAGSYFAEESDTQKKTKDAKEKELTAYKQFGIYLRANPNIKPSSNKHEK
jgi:hypothetical protein